MRVVVIKVRPGKSLDSIFGHLVLGFVYGSETFFGPGDVAVMSGPALKKGESVEALRAVHWRHPYRQAVWAAPLNATFHQYSTIENRDQVIYELALTNSQIKDVVFRVNAWLTNAPVTKPYSLLNRNCAILIARLLESVTGRDFGGGVFDYSPLTLPNVLLEAGLVRAVAELPRGTF